MKVAISSCLVRFRPDFPAMRNLRAGEGIASAMATFKPASAACSAAIIPAGPAPTISTSQVRCCLLDSNGFFKLYATDPQSMSIDHCFDFLTLMPVGHNRVATNNYRIIYLLR